MRYTAGHKEATRTKVLETAAHVFRRDGIAASGVATLMNEAGLTNGAFYAHFASKEALVAEAVAHALKATGAGLAQAAQQAAPGEALDAVIARYLDPRHVDHPAHGCAVAALGAELGRRPDASRAVIEAAIDDVVAVFAGALPADHPHRTEAARAVFASLVGTLQLARTCRASEVPSVLRVGAAAARLVAQVGR